MGFFDRIVPRLLSSWLSVSDLEDEFVETLPGLRALIKKCK